MLIVKLKHYDRGVEVISVKEVNYNEGRKTTLMCSDRDRGVNEYVGNNVIKWVKEIIASLPWPKLSNRLPIQPTSGCH